MSLCVSYTSRLHRVCTLYFAPFANTILHVVVSFFAPRDCLRHRFTTRSREAEVGDGHEDEDVGDAGES